MTTPSSAIGPVLFNNPSLADDDRRRVMNPYQYEGEIQRQQKQPSRFRQSLSAFVNKLRRPRQRRRVPAETTPARGSPKGA